MINETRARNLRSRYSDILNRAGINTPLRLAHFFAQLDHESGLRPISENLNYSAQGLLRTFPRYFKTIEVAQRYARKPEMIANRVYANRMGNGGETSGDGWRYRGRGFIQLTGKNNYAAFSRSIGREQEILNNPDLLLNEEMAMRAAIWFWTINNINRLADTDNVVRVTRAINGGTNGLEDRQIKTKKYKEVFK